jgi:tRNA(fMet)-specific endonuclease VapC
MRSQPAVVDRLTGVAPDDCAVSSITVYELYAGIEKCSDPSRERPKVERFLKTVHVVPFDLPAALESGRIRATLERAGQIIGPYDLLLAGHALTLQLVMVTNNVKEFTRVPGLLFEDWHRSTP